MENEDLYRNLVILLKMFKNRPYHLAKYLIENYSLTNMLSILLQKVGYLIGLKNQTLVVRRMKIFGKDF